MTSQEELTRDLGLEFWQRRSGRALSSVDLGEITTNIAGFFGVLMDWQAAGQEASAATLDVGFAEQGCLQETTARMLLEILEERARFPGGHGDSPLSRMLCSLPGSLGNPGDLGPGPYDRLLPPLPLGIPCRWDFASMASIAGGLWRCDDDMAGPGRPVGLHETRGCPPGNVPRLGALDGGTRQTPSQRDGAR